MTDNLDSLPDDDLEWERPADLVEQEAAWRARMQDEVSHVDLFPLYDLAALRDLPPVRWLIPGRMPEGITVLYGPPGAGKSFAALDWTLTLASDALGDPGLVVYCAGEGISGIPERVNSWVYAHNQKHAPDGFRLVPKVPNVLDGWEMERFGEQLARLDPTIIVIDTWARALAAGGGDENSTADTGRAIANVEELRAVTGASVLIVHHSNADGSRERGNTALRGAADAMFSLTNDGQVRLENNKQKDGPLAPTFTGTLHPYGQSCVLWPTTPNSLRPAPPSTGANDGRA